MVLMALNVNVLNGQITLKVGVFFYYKKVKTEKYIIAVSSITLSVYLFIRKTCPCNVYPLEPHLYIAKLGYAGVHLFFLFLLQNIDCGYSARRF